MLSQKMETKSQNNDYYQYEKELEDLSKERTKLGDELVDTDEEAKQLLIRKSLFEIKEKETKLKEKIKEIQEKELNSFMERVNLLQEKSFKSDDSKIYQTAYTDAATRAYHIICVSPERIADFFAIPNIQTILKSNSQISVTPTKSEHFWMYDSTMRIPLSPGIRTPIRKKNNEIIGAFFFTISKFFYDQSFVEQCRDYYRKFGLDFSYEKIEMKNDPANPMNSKKRYKWKLILKPFNGKLFFPVQ